jgi:CheY-like chemotaxis protein
MDLNLSLHFLVVEDTRIHQAIAKSLLAKDGHTVTVLENGQEAVDAFQAGLRVDVVLMDVEMPEMDGLVATQQIRQREYASGDHQLIIALTATADPETCRAAGMDGFLHKPLAISALYEILEHCTQLAGPRKPR